MNLRWIDEQTAARCDDSLPKAEDSDPRPLLFPWLVEVYKAWEFFGSGVTVLGGLAVSVVDDSHKLYRPRLAWLDEHGHRSETARAFYLGCWKVMDSEMYAITNDHIEAHRKKD